MSHNLTQPEEIDHVLMTMADLVSSGVAQPDETSADAEGNRRVDFNHNLNP